MDVRRVHLGEELLLRRLFFETVHEVNSRDYTAEQLAVWAPTEFDADAWSERIIRNQPFVCAEVDDENDTDILAGFADVQPDGYIDQFFVHHQWQRQGVGKRLMQAIHDQAAEWGLTELVSDVSITARPFFEAWGFVVVTPQQVVRDGVTLDNFRMRKMLV